MVQPTSVFMSFAITCNLFMQYDYIIDMMISQSLELFNKESFSKFIKKRCEIIPEAIRSPLPGPYSVQSNHVVPA